MTDTKPPAKAALFAPRLKRATVPVESVGEIEVRALSRAEALECQAQQDLAAAERAILRYGVCTWDLSDSDVRRWAAAAPAGELEDVTKEISRLSGMLEQPRDVMARFRAQPDAGN